MFFTFIIVHNGQRPILNIGASLPNWEMSNNHTLIQYVKLFKINTQNAKMRSLLPSGVNPLKHKKRTPHSWGPLLPKLEPFLIRTRCDHLLNFLNFSNRLHEHFIAALVLRYVFARIRRYKILGILYRLYSAQ